MQLPEAYLARMRALLGADFRAYLAAMERPVRRALRVNALKCTPAECSALCNFPLAPTGAASGSFYVPETLAVGRHPLHAAGLFYMQEPSATLPAPLTGAKPHMRVLDLCAAPGGKTGQLAALLENTGLLVANEPVPSRAAVLSGNLERLGVTNAVVTNASPEALESRFPAFFDAVLVDAPCSGEGMFRKEPAAVADWSPEAVQACALRQRKILDSAAVMTKPGGTLVYSTCTFSKEEDEETVAAFLDAHPDFSLITTRRVYPHTGPGEGQFMALLHRGDTAPVPAAPKAMQRPARVPAEARALWDAFCKDTLIEPLPRDPVFLSDGRILLPPEGFAALPGVRMLRAGLLLGEIKGNRIEPAHALFLALPADRFQRCVPLDETAAARYLAGETLPCDKTLSGWCAVTYRGYPLGFGKAVQGTLKNHYPKGLRIPSP